jgi:hypothetical protein
LSIRLILVSAQTPGQLEPAFSTILAQTHRRCIDSKLPFSQRIGDASRLLAEARLPMIESTEAFVDAGG